MLCDCSNHILSAPINIEIRIFRFRQEARDIIRTAVNASEDDTVIFSGHGCTHALEKLISALDLRDAPIIFTGPTEHHDNINIWQKTGAKVSFYMKTRILNYFQMRKKLF